MLSNILMTFSLVSLSSTALVKLIANVTPKIITNNSFITFHNCWLFINSLKFFCFPIL